MRSKHARRSDSRVAQARDIREEAAKVLSIGQDRLLQTRPDRTGWGHSIAVAMSTVAAAVIEGFAAYALAMHPESLCRSGERVDRGDATEDPRADAVRPERPHAIHSVDRALPGPTQLLPFSERRRGSRQSR